MQSLKEALSFWKCNPEKIAIGRNKSRSNIQVLSEDELVEKMLIAYHRASWPPTKESDVRRGIKAALHALLGSLTNPDDNGLTDDGCDLARLYRELLAMRKE